MSIPITEWNNPIPGNAGNGLNVAGTFPSLSSIMNPSSESFQSNQQENQQGFSQGPLPQFSEGNFGANQYEFNNVMIIMTNNLKDFSFDKNQEAQLEDSLNSNYNNYAFHF